MKPNRINLLLFVSVFISLGLVAGYDFLPLKEYTIVPSNSWRAELFSSGSSGHLNASRWADKSKSALHCDVQPVDSYQYCGLNFYFDWEFVNGYDFSGFQQLKLKARYTGQAERVRLFMRNYNARYSRATDANSAKYLSVVLAAEEFSSTGDVVIDLNEFTVADWWLSQRTLGRKLVPPEYSNITVIGFDFGEYLKDVNSVELHIDSLAFTGPWVKPQYWYLGILFAWMAVILIVASQKIIMLLAEMRYFERESKRFQKLSNIDSLTGAHNRMGIEKRIEKFSLIKHGAGIGVILIDIDHFKRVNDHRGHDVGDKVLKLVVELIKHNIREHDVLGRWGGEEFVLITPYVDENATYKIAEKIRSLIAVYNFVPEEPIRITASFGVTSIRGNEDFSVTFKRADKALYKAKGAGRNCTFIAD